MTQEVHFKDISFANSPTSGILRLNSAMSIVGVRIPVSGTWGANTTITFQTAFGTDILGDQTAPGDIADWADIVDNSGGTVQIVANAGTNPRLILHDVWMAGNFFRLVAGAAKTATVRVFYKSIT